MSKLTKTIETFIFLTLTWFITGIILGKGLYFIFGYSIAIKQNGCIFLGFFVSTLIIILYLFIRLILFIIRITKNKKDAHAEK